MPKLQAAALPLASNSAFCPAGNDAGTATAAIGRNAACTALSASTMPAPHWLVVQEHSPLVGSVLGQTGIAAVFGGKGLALDCRRAIN